MQAFGVKPVHIAATLGSIVMALTFVVIRLRATKKPTSAKKIILPPIAMSTGFLMFLYPSTHIPVTWGIIAFLAGAVFFSYPLIRTSHFHVVDGDIYLKRSKAFIFILLGLLILRLGLHSYVEELFSIPQTGAVFFILAFGMILPWRVAMYIQYRRLLKKIKTESHHVD
ncbi:CcdC family protein [Polycladomyces subterraneus]|uniref:Cytochrome c biogenesis protein CcdC n=1 Tax=Polycladomyces subterraneus TaxID=1016997 RepID=A0ABT8IPR3_9BACL|nr:cytochrome c biogenesis protein CcdC [Polycladomyces subterraneus]MDN4594773.1 cytochrome c biogenesis protein CcdC [Polycladomyces subterraneus]